MEFLKTLWVTHVPFASYEMKLFAASWEFNFTHSSPGYAQSNWLGERTIQTVKCALKKAMQTGTDSHLVLLSLRNTAVTRLNMTPAQTLVGRALRSTLPCSSATLKQSILQRIHSRIQDLEAPQSLYHDWNVNPLPALAPGTTVHVQTRRGWALNLPQPTPITCLKQTYLTEEIRNPNTRKKPAC